MEEEIKIEADGKIDTTPTIKPSVVRLTRTYQSDIAEAVKSGQGSLINIVMKEQEKKKVYEQKTSLKSGKNIFVLLFSLLFIIGGIGLFSYFVYIKKTQDNVVLEKKSQDFIYTNNQIQVALDNLNRRETLIKIRETIEGNLGSLGSITKLYFTKKNEGAELQFNTSGILVSALSTRVPRDFLRFLEGDFIFATHSLSSGNQPFFVFKINSYEYAFANMLEWEKDLEDDFFPIFNPDPSLRTETRSVFKDLIIENRDVRAILDDQENILFAYSFPDKNHLVFVNNESTFKEILLRLGTAELREK